MKTILPSVIAGLLLTTAALPAQPPKGWLIASAFNIAAPSPLNGLPGGLFLVHPRNSGMEIAVQGLPSEMTAAGYRGYTASAGSSGIAMLPDGSLLVGEATPPAGSMPGIDAVLEVHRVWLSEQQGAWIGQVLQSYGIATMGSGNGEVTDLEPLPNGNVVVSYHLGLSQVLLAELDPTTGLVNPVFLQGFPTGSVINALASSANGTTVYLGEASTGQTGEIWTLPLPLSPTTNPVTQLTSMGTTGSVHALDRDNAGNLVAGKWAMTGGTFTVTQLLGVNAQTGTVNNLLPGSTIVPNAVLVERNTGDCFTGGVWHIPHAGGGPVRLTPPMTRGVVAGFAMLPAVDSYGSQSTCMSTGSYEWQTAPNPGGLPLVGDAGFSITMQAPGPQPVSLFAFSFAPATAPLPLPNCAQLWLGQGTLFASLIIGSTVANPSTFTFPLGIPNSPGLAGTSLFAQSFHLPGAAPLPIESSPGLCITIL